MLWKISKKFQVSAEKFIPDAIVFCLGLTIVIFIVGLFVPGSHPLTMLNGWYDKMWEQIGFAFQMSMLVLMTSAAAQAPQVRKVLTGISRLPKSRVSAILCILVFGFLSGLINWAFCMILVPIFAKEVCRQNKNIHFPLMIAVGYATMPLSQTICPSESAYALLASSDHFMVDRIGVLSPGVTCFSPLSFAVFACVAVSFTVITLLIKPPASEIISYNGEADLEAAETPLVNSVMGKKCLADRMNHTRFILPVIGLAALVILVEHVIRNGFINSLNFNFVIFVFLTLNLFLYNTPMKFMSAMEGSIGAVVGVMIQFPLYGGIMGIMESSGLTTLISNALVSLCTLKTFPPVSFLSAAIVNVFIPSQGGQWLVQGPFLVDAAEQLGANLGTLVTAFCHGDESTNLINPLYMIPAIAMVKLKLKDVWGFMFFYSLIWIVVACLALLILPSLLGVAAAL